MKFIEDIRTSLGLKKYEMYKRLKLESPQAYISLANATQRITFKDLIKLRKNLGLTDTQLLDLIEKELSSSEDAGRNPE